MRSLFFVAAAAVLSSAACADAVAPVAQADEARAQGVQAAAIPPSGFPRYLPRDSIYTSQTPTEFLDAAPGWQVGTRFIPDYDGRFVGFRFYKAPNETGSHTAKLYTTFGQLVATANFTNETPSGWQRVTFTNVVYGQAGQEYYVTVNTNSKQAKTPGYFHLNGPIFRNWGAAYGGAYGQPIHAFPGSGSASSFFVDVYYRALICDEENTSNCY
jgi:hypothetical protein